LKIGLEYIKYRWNTKVRKGIPSPFIRDFYKTCLSISLDSNSRAELKQLFTRLKSDQRILKIEDFGAGSKKLGSSRKVSTILKTSSSKGKYGKILYQLNKHYQFKNCLELGTSLGVGTTYLSLGFPESNITTIEACGETRAVALENFEIKPNINCVHLTFENFLKNHQDVIYDFVYIDGHHDGEALKQYIKMLEPFTNVNTIYMLDDIRWSQSMFYAWKNLSINDDFEVAIDLFRIGILRKSSS